MAILIYNHTKVYSYREQTVVLMEQLVYSPKSLGLALKRQRKAKQLNQKEAGFPFKLEQTTVSSIEQGAAGTRIETLFRMLAALDLEMVIRTKNKLEETGTGGW